MRRLLWLMVGLFLTSLEILAQNKTLTGRITDGSGKPVAGASITVKNSRTGTVTQDDGTFSLSVPANAEIINVSAIGFTAKEVNIKNQTNVSVSITADDQNLQEVVVSTGYRRERKSQFSGAATVLNASKTVELVPVGAFDQALQGQAPGVLVNSGTGQPGSSASITIRGTQSIQGAGAQPLFVIDGVPVASANFATINPNDFETITILKDANAAALYGARGGTGVVVLTTKKGRAGATQVTFRTQLGVTKAPDFGRLNMMNTKEILGYEEYMGRLGQNTNTPGWVYSKVNPNYNVLQTGFTSLAQQQARYDFMLDSIGGINRDYSKDFYRDGLSQTHEVNVSGGSDKTRFFLSGGMFDQQGIDLAAALKRYTTRFNIEHTAGKFTVTLNSALGYSNTTYSEGEYLGNSARNPFQMTYRAKPYENPYKADGTLNYGANTTLALKQVANLLEGIENSDYTRKQFKFNGGLTLAYKILPNLTLRNIIGLDMASEIWQHYINPRSFYGTSQGFAGNAGEDRESYRLNTQLINTTSLMYNNTIADVHDFEVGAFFETITGREKALGFTLYNLDYRLPLTGQGAGTLPVAAGQTTYTQPASSANSGYGIRSYFATARYTYNDRYSINFNVRNDGTSRIVNKENREIFTWSAGATWNAMQEDFMKNQTILSDLRVRASYGITPNISSISTSTYGVGGGLISITNYQGPQVPSFGTTAYAGSGLTGLAPSSAGNRDLKIERIHKTNLGVDFAVWQNRARFVVDAYYNRTVDLFVNQPLPASSGFGGSSMPINAGVMTNKGLEFTANVDVIRNKDFGVTVGINHSINQNEIVDLGAVSEYFSGTFVIREGLPYGTHFTTHYLGADPATGRPMFYAQDGKTIVYDAGQAGNFADWGTYLPKHTGGFNADIRYKRFSVSALFSYQFDVTRSNNIRNWITRGTPGYHASVNASKELLTNQWQQAGDNKLFQSPAYDRGFTSSDLENGKFLRFRNLIVSYSLPSIRVAGTQLLKGGRIYVQGQNLAIWSPWTGLDPEDNNNISLNEYPNPKMFVVGLDINF